MSHQKAPSTNPRISLKFKQKEAALYKTEFCRNWVELGQCRQIKNIIKKKEKKTYSLVNNNRYGSKCRYAHGEEEIRIVPRHARYKTQICRAYHSDGSCPYGTRCTFIHDSDSPIDRKEANSSLMTASNTNGSTDNIDFIWNGKLTFKSNSMKQTFPVVSIPRRDSFTSHDGSSSETSFSGDESSLINSPASLTNSFIMKQPNAAIETMKYYRADRTLQALFSTNKNKPLWM